ncbi:MAG: NAD(+) synthase [Gammaproteobacteria bacterium]|nr:NAD(+) synthase [Gammaproteobacteria bacterium]
MDSSLKIAICQGHFPVGAIAQNAQKILDESAKSEAAILVFPELALSGYPPEDLLFQAEFRLNIEAALRHLQANLPPSLLVLVGAPIYRDGKIYNALLAFFDGQVIYEYHKQVLPNLGVFDDKRYFTAGTTSGMLIWKSLRLGLLICEDCWHNEPILQFRDLACDHLICINASPFSMNKEAERLERAQFAVDQLKIPFIYLNHQGIQDELIYDGGSFLLAPDSAPLWLGARFQGSPVEVQYQALCFALRGYVDHHRFPGVLLGLSGGVDSALTLAIAVDALGPERVEVILMPSAYTADMSIEDAQEEAARLGVKNQIIPIEILFKTALSEISPHFEHQKWDLTEENIQARLRGLILMALSNKSGKMVLTTTNKSELAVGYGTLYGDMAGGFALLKDIYKMEVYALARYRNGIDPVIPERVLMRAPSAELRENQTDQDALPDYVLLDQIIQQYQEENKSTEEIIAKLGHEIEVKKVIALIDRNEYKRRQSPIGPKISKRAFGRDWRMPIMKG